MSFCSRGIKDNAMNKRRTLLAKSSEMSDNGLKLDSHAYERSLGTLNEAQRKEVRRLEFSAKTKRILAARVGYRCSNPSCKVISTIGPGDGPDEVVILGEAAHIVGAIQGGKDSLSPRADRRKDPDYIKSVDNGIWLCRNCHKLVDARDSTYTVETLRDWKNEAERRQAKLLEEQPSSFVKEYVWPSIKLNKGISTGKFKDEEWCLLAYMMDKYEAHGSSKDGLCFESEEGCDFQNGYQSWMSEHSISPKRSGLDFSAPQDVLRSKLREIVCTLTGLVKMDEYSLDYGEEFENFAERFNDEDPNGLRNLIHGLSCIE